MADNLDPRDLHDPSDFGPLTQRQAENIADLAAQRAEQRLYTAIGRKVVKKTLFLLGAAGSAILIWLAGHEHFFFKFFGLE